MGRGFWTSILIVILLIGFWNLRRPQKVAPVVGSDEVVSEAPAPEAPSIPESDPPPTVPVEKSEEVTAPVPPESGRPRYLDDNFVKAMNTMHTCLKVGPSPQLSSTEPSIGNWSDNLQKVFGEQVLKSEDWSNTHITLPNGERRRIRIETELTEDDRVVRRLKYANVDREDLPMPIELSDSQSEDPTDAFVASLEKEGDVTLTEKAERNYFRDGSEFFSVQRNGVVSEVEVNRPDGKAFRCWSMDKEGGQCECL